MNVPLYEIMNFMEEIAPSSDALDWDNVGLQVGDPNSPVNSILLSLDVSPSIVGEASGMSADLIISHHPLIFRPISSIDFSQPVGQIIRDLIRHGIALYSSHTNLDRCKEGTGISLARKLGLKDIRQYSEDEKDEMNMVVTGNFHHPLSLEELLELFRKKIECKNMRIVGNPRNLLATAIIPGSGGSIITKLKSHYDLIITGELSYHDALTVDYQGRTVVLLGHFISEKPVMYHLRELLTGKFPSLSINVSTNEGEPYRVIYQDIEGKKTAVSK